MWPFKKKRNEVNEILPIKFTSIICIPGSWKNWEEFMDALISANNGEYIAAGGFMVHMKRKGHYTIDFCEYDEKMKEAFKYAGSVTRVSDDFLDEIGHHRHVVYVSGETGSLETAAELAMAAAAILKAGGIGIKIETAGKAFEKYTWLEQCESPEPRLYDMFVLDSLIDENGTVFSCGMQNIGLKDTIISGEEFQSANDMIRIFGFYQIVDKPFIRHNQTFGKDVESPRFRITDEPYPPYKDNKEFGNPFGMWRLSKE